MGTTFRCCCALRALAVISLLVAFAFGAEQSDETVTPQGNPGWVEIPAAEAGLPSIETADLIRRVKAANANDDRWEMRYHVKQVPNPDQYQRNQKTDADIHLARSDDDWRYDVNFNDEANSQYSVEYYITGDQVTYLMHQSKLIGVSADLAVVGNYQPMHPLPPYLLPGVKAPEGVRPDQFTPGSIGDVIDSIPVPEAKVLPWCTKIDGRLCYVIETSSKVTMPVFRDHDQWNAWYEANPSEWEMCSLGGMVVVIDPMASDDQTAYAKQTHRIAVDPESDFHIVRWSRGAARGVGNQERMRMFPEFDVHYTFDDDADSARIPEEVLVTQYLTAAPGGDPQFLIETRLDIKEFTCTPAPSCFKPPTFPEGYRVMDRSIGIIYNVGDPPELIAKLKALAAHRSAFYDRLSGMEQLPALKAASWVNSAPIDLADCRGRPVDLYFWSIGCGPCLFELPRIEEEYQRNRKIEDSPRIILIHGHAPKSMVEKVKSTLEKKGVTIPCMIDTSFKGRTWGQTHADYGVQSVPTRIRTGADGKVLSHGRSLINAHSLETSLFAPKQEE